VRGVNAIYPVRAKLVFKKIKLLRKKICNETLNLKERDVISKR